VKIISFAWTSAPLLAGRKTVTRRNWNPRHARRFHAGDLIAAYDRQPRFRGRQIATIRLTAEPYLERFSDLQDSEWEAEGFAYLEEQGINDSDGWSPEDIWHTWKRADPDVAWWVVRFELVNVLD
jgi:hypothetical protein